VGDKERNKSRELRRARAAIDQQRGDKRRWVLIVGAAVIVALLVAIVVTVVKSANTPKAQPISTSGPMVTPTGATSDGALVSGKADARVTLDVYLDYMCPFCGRFERADGEEIARLVADGTVRLKLHPLSFLDRNSNGSQYSTRAANAVTTAADRAPQTLLAFNNILFSHQPAEGTGGLTDNEIASLAREAGVPQPVVDAFGDHTFVPWVAASTQKAFASGITGTPTVKINGNKYTGDLFTKGPLTQAITEAAK
jgi:protein-disulfide isomerase